MQNYKNLGGDSNVAAFEMGINSIKVKFKDGSVYLYNTGSAGFSRIEEMKKIALEGRGLNSYINRYVRKGYASKSR